MIFARAMPKPFQTKFQNPDLRQMAPAVDPAAVTIIALQAKTFCKPRRKEIKGSGTPKDVGHNRRNFRCGARLARRARLPAFHHGSHLRELFHPKGSARARLPGHGADKRRVAPAGAGFGCSDAPRAPVLVPAGMMPEPPGSSSDEPPPAGTALAPISRRHRLMSFT